MSSSLPNVATVRALPGHKLVVEWRDGGTDVVDLGAVLALHPSFAPLRDEAAFADVHVVDWGGGIEWESGADYAADALHVLALQQREAGPVQRPEVLEELLAGYDRAAVGDAIRAWLNDPPRGKEIP